jgi:guanine deaminase
VKLFRSSVFHTPANPFIARDALAAFEDGALAIEDGKIAACGEYALVRASYPEAEVRDLRDGYILPGFIDTHIHFPQVRILGGLGYSLLDWLDELTLPEEAKFADEAYARGVAAEFVQRLAAHGTTTALVFGSHFAEATAALFEAAAGKGLRIVSGLVWSDRLLPAELLQTPEAAYRASRRLIDNIRDKPRLSYAVMPRFALSAGEAMLEVCRTLMREEPGLLFTTHINENFLEIEEAGRKFPWAEDYLGIYESFGLISRRSVLAHDIHTSDSQLKRLAESGASVAHCPCSNAALGSGIFPMRRHIENNVRVALGTDVGGGIGFGMLKEALQAYLLQRVAPDPVTLSPAQMLYLATAAGAEALNMADTTGDFRPGKSADFVYLRAPKGAGDRRFRLSEIFTLADAGWIQEVYVDGDLIHDHG